MHGHPSVKPALCKTMTVTPFAKLQPVY